MIKRLFIVPLVVGLNVVAGGTASAAGSGGNFVSPPPTSQGTASVVLNTLEAGAGGTYTPMTAKVFGPTGRDQPNPVGILPGGPDPQGRPCPPVKFFRVHNPGGGVVTPGIGQGSAMGATTFYPRFTRNAAGGYDGSDSNYGYSAPNVIPPGGDPAATAIGSPASAATMAGHVVGVGAILIHQGSWQDATPGRAPYGGSCVGAAFTFGPPFIAGNAPPPVPPRSVLRVPPFALGSALMAEVTGAWRIGHVETLPGPTATSRTYVHIPTCAWLDTGVPTSVVAMHAVKTTVESGLTLFLVYNLMITPGPVTWSWGDGTSSQTTNVVGAPPAAYPAYDPTTQTWSDPCEVSHQYAAVASGRTITVSQPFSVTITVSWNDGVSNHTAPVPCDLVTGGACTLVVGAANGWSSGPHPVDQIEAVPYSPSSPSALPR